MQILSLSDYAKIFAKENKSIFYCPSLHRNFIEYVNNSDINFVVERDFTKIYPRTDYNKAFGKDKNVDIKTDFTHLLYAFYIMYSEDIERIYNVLNMEYNPLDNYDRNETISRTHGERVEIFDKGNQRNSFENAEKVTDTNYGKTETNMHYGEDTRTTQVSPYDSEVFYNKEKVDTLERDDKQTQEAKQDSVTQNAFTDYAEEGKRHDISTYETYVDTDNIHARGNIGVTKTQEMLSDEINVRMHNNFLHYFLEMFSNHCCYPPNYLEMLSASNCFPMQRGWDCWRFL